MDKRDHLGGRNHLDGPDAIAHNKAPQAETNGGSMDPTVGLGDTPILSDELTGLVLGDYQLLEPIGSGGGGRVYKATHRRMDRVVAVKIFSQGVLEEAKQLKRFQREVRAAAKLLHPNIVTAFDAGEHDAMHFLVMEYVDGQSLGEVVRNNGPLAVDEATRYLVQAAQGLVYAHSRGVVHRDIKPDNIMVDRQGHVKLLDMGLARLSNFALQESGGAYESAELTTQGIVIGTVGFISPEQISDPSNVDARCDIYSLGCTYYFLLTGMAPFSGSILEVLQAHAETPAPRVTDFCSGGSYRLETLIQRMMAKAPEERVGSAQELIPLLEQFADAAAAGQASDDNREQQGRRQAAGASDDQQAVPLSVGIDIGTESAHVSVYGDDGGLNALADRAGAIATPTALLIRDGRALLGRPAIRAAATDCAGFVDRLTGALGEVDAPESACQLDGQPLPHEAVLGLVAAKLEGALKQDFWNFANPTYTVPGCFGAARRRAYRDAYWIATGQWLESVGAAASVAVQFSFLHGWLNPRIESDRKSLLVFRYGAGSFDATVFRVEQRRLTSLAIAGDSRLGESAWDDQVVERVVREIKTTYGDDAFGNPVQMFLLRRQIKAMKTRLGEKESRHAIKLTVGDRPLKLTLGESVVRHVGNQHLKRAQALTTCALERANVGWDELDHVLLAGHAAHAPFVNEQVKQWSGHQEICSVAGADVAASGTALIAHNERGAGHSHLDFQVCESASHDYIVRTLGADGQPQSTQTVIDQGTLLPAAVETTVAKTDGRTPTLIFELVERNAVVADHETLLGKCTVENLPPGLPAGAPIDLSLTLDRRGMLSVFTTSPSTGRRVAPKIEPVVGMTDAEREQWRTRVQDLADRS